ncbi:unnamed protein product [Ixodes persulcatus]
MRNGASTAVCLKLVQSTDGRLGGTFAIWQRCEASRKSSARVPKHIRRLPFERAAPVVGVAQQQSALLDFCIVSKLYGLHHIVPGAGLSSLFSLRRHILASLV